MIKHEAKFTTRLSKWLKYNWHETGPIEVKVSKTGRININQFAIHQLAALNLAANGTLVWKVPDAGFQNLFDLVVYSRSRAFVCLVFHVETSDRFYVLEAQAFVRFFQERPGVVSITEEEAEIVAVKNGILN